MPLQLSDLRRNLAQRMRYWGGDVSTGASGVLSANGTNFTCIDTARPEPDDEWNDSYIVLNPGTTSAIWRRVAAIGGWVLSTGTLTLSSPLPSASNSVAGTPYELYKVFRPEEWKQAVNWSLTNAYPQRHRKVIFEVPMDDKTRVYDWQQMVQELAIVDPTVAPTVSVQPPNGTGLWQPGTYTFGYTYFNDAGESLISPTVSVTVVTPNSVIRFAQMTISDTAVGVNYYSSLITGGTHLGKIATGQAFVTDPSAPSNAQVAIGSNGVVWQADFNQGALAEANFPPAYNTTSLDVIDLATVQKRNNPGQYPEVWTDLSNQYWRPVGSTSIQVEFRPWGTYNLRFICTGIVQTLNNETDQTREPVELIYAGGEYYLWDLLSKQSTVIGTNWDKLLKTASDRYEDLKQKYALDRPRKVSHRPYINPSV